MIEKIHNLDKKFLSKLFSQSQIIFTQNFWFLRWFHQENMCLDSMDGKEGGKPGLWKCHDIGKNQVNIYNSVILIYKNETGCFIEM